MLFRSINLLNHVPADVKATDLLRYVQRMFCLGIVKEPFDPDYELVPLGDLLAQAPTHDWTDRLLANPTKSQTTNRIGGFIQLNDGFEAPDGATNITLPPFTVAGTVDTYYDTIPLTVPGYYYVRALDCYYLLTDTYSALYFPQSQYIHDPDDDSRLNLDLGAANTTQVSMVQLDGDIRGGTMPFVALPGGSTLKPAKYPLLLMAYRGVYDLHSPPGKLPLASRAPYDMDGNVIGDYSLGWDGPLGIYAKWWKNWHQFLYNRTEVTARLTLTLPDILNFRFKHIIRIQNMNYFVKSLRVNFTQRGLEPVEAKLVSIV